MRPVAHRQSPTGVGVGVTTRWYLLDGINPEPWTAPTANLRRSAKKTWVQMMKDPKLTAFQNAVREDLERLYGPEIKLWPSDVPLGMSYYFWRSTAFGQPADLDNLQKATSDALQGVLFDNDRAVTYVESAIVEQAPDVIPKLVIGVFNASGFRPHLPDKPEPRVATGDSERRGNFDPTEVF